MTLREIFFENWTLKLTAIFLACILWLIVRGDPAGVREITVPLEVRIPRNMEITNDRPSSVDVTVRGTVSSIWVGQSIPMCRVDLQSADEGEHTVPLAPDNIQISRATGLEVLAVRPPRLTLVLEHTIAKQVPIRVQTGPPDQGFEVYGISHSPTAIQIVGPKSHIEKIRELPTESISLSGHQQTLRTVAYLMIQDSLVRTQTMPQIEVSVEIGPQRRLHTVSRIPVVSDDDSLAVQPSRIAVKVLVPVTYERKLTAEDFVARIPLQDMDPERTTARVRVEVRFATPLDPAIVIRDIQPDEVTVRRTGKS